MDCCDSTFVVIDRIRQQSHKVTARFPTDAVQKITGHEGKLNQTAVPASTFGWVISSDDRTIDMLVVLIDP
jgi:hypothetical protein